MAESFEKMGIQGAVQALSADAAQGLDPAEAQRRLEAAGPNVLAAKKGKSPVVKFLQQFNDPMIYILFAAVVVSLFLREYTDSIIILTVVLVNGVIGYLQEAKAEKAIEALKKLASPRAVVRRGGSVMEIDAAGLVPGDLVLLEAGRFVPADLRLTETSNLKVEESALTGESVPVEKDAAFAADGDLPLGDRVNMAYMSTNVSYGRGAGVVTATGMNTEIGKIAAIIGDTAEGMTPLQKRLADLGKVLGIVTVALCAVLFVAALLQKRNLLEMLLTAISLAVAAIPEGLPAVVTIVLALGVQRMAKSRSIIRKLPAVETLGAVNVVCSDKTGTLTQNRMTVLECWFDGRSEKPQVLDPQKAALFFEGFALCNDASVGGGQKLGDPTEIALLDMGVPLGFERPALEEKFPRIDEIPFDSTRKMMTTVHRRGGKCIAFTKGAIDNLLRHTVSIYENGAARPITPEDIKQINAAAAKMASDALRVLALAYRECAPGEPPTEENLVFLGFAGMIDPPRPEAKQAVKVCRKAGITTVMITGDHRDTALAIAKELGIAKDAGEAVSGEELNRMTQEELNEKVGRLRVFARVSPENKVAIVNAFKSRGNIVSMTGDGVNDAPSLKAADIGVAMGVTGTDVAKGAADMILTDDNFATIEKAIEEGRNIYNNIRKATLYLLASNFGEILTMFVAVIAFLPVPLSPVHILWVNLVTDSLPGLALGVDPGNPAIMKKKPRDPSESLFARGGLLNLLIYGVVIGGSTLLGFLLGWHEGGLREGRTFALTILAVSQLFHAIGMRDVDKSIFRMNHLSNKALLGSVALGLLLQFAVVQLPAVNRVFGTVALDAWQWLTALALALTPLAMHEILLLIRKAAGRA